MLQQWQPAELGMLRFCCMLYVSHLQSMLVPPHVHVSRQVA
jgi:hypothetical protein